MAWWLAQNVVVTAALALIVVAACRLLRVGPVARHALWVLVLIKFITPPLVVWPWALPDPLGLTAHAPVEEPAMVETSASDRERAGTSGNEGDRSRTSGNDGERAEVASTVSASFWIPTIWIAGSIFVLGLESLRLLRLRRRVSRAALADAELQSRIDNLAIRLDVSGVSVRVVDGIPSPMVWSLGRPQLLWPSDLPPDASDACLDGLIVHELAHIRRRDHIVGWLELAAGVLWWWNPLFWFVRASRREQAELACDAWVISVLPNGRRAYAESLLALSGAAVRGAPSMVVVGIRATSRRVLERRLVMIMKGSTPLRLPVMGFVGLAFAAAMTLPAWAMSPQQPQTPPPPPASQPAPTGAPQAAPLPPVPPSQVSTTTPPPVVQVTPTRPLPSRRVGPRPTVAIAVPSSAPAARPTAMPTMAPPDAAGVPARRTPPAYAQQVPPPPPGTPVVTSPRPARKDADFIRTVPLVAKSQSLPAEGQQIYDQFNADRTQIQQDATAKVEARRQAFIKQLEALQDQLAKAGKLDEAVAVRNYLRTMNVKK